jgi:hypothetical protein
LMKREESLWPSTLPWGTPLTTSVQSERVEEIWTRCWRFDKKLLIHFCRWPDIPQGESLWSRRGCDTTSNAFEKSRYVVSYVLSVVEGCLQLVNGNEELGGAGVT